MLATMTNKLTEELTHAFNMLGPKRKATFSLSVVHTVFLIICL